MSTTFLRDLVAHMRETGETSAEIDDGRQEPTHIEYRPRTDSERAALLFTLHDVGETQTPTLN